MATSEVAHTSNPYLQTPRVVKCPTPQCPGWITVDSTRHQTEPCRYCRVGVDTLRFLLSRVGADNKVLSPEVHGEFNRLMLTMAGAWGQNVYLRPSHDTLVDIKPGTRGVTVEYNPYLGDAGSEGAAPLVGVILHKLLHFEAHLGQRAPQLVAKSGSKDKEAYAPILSYLLTVTDHAWVTARLEQLNPMLHSAQSRWGLDLVTMLVGSESMFNRYLSERNLMKLLGVLKETDNADSFRASVLDRLSAQTAQILAPEKEESRRIFLAVQLANVHLLNPDAYDDYLAALQKKEIANLREAQPMADKVYTEMEASPISNAQPPKSKDGESAPTTTVDLQAYLRALEGAVKALGMGNYFDVTS